MISKFCPVGHLILTRILPPPPHPPELFELSKGSVISQTNARSQFLRKSALDLVGQFFLKMMLGEMSEWGEQKNFKGGNLPWIML